MAKVRAKIKKDSVKFISPFKNYWVKKNYLIFNIGILLLLVGFYLMSQGPWNNPISLTYSPIILLIVYVVVFPLSILYNNKKNKGNVPSEN